MKQILIIEHSVTTGDLRVHELKEEVLLTLEKHTNLSEIELLSFSIALEEAILNAYEHGNLELKSVWKEEYPEGEESTLFHLTKQQRLQNAEFSQRKVVIQIRIAEKQVEVAVIDEGCGSVFNQIDKVAHAQTDRKPHRAYGMGIIVMQQLVDDLKFNEKGNRVILVKKLQHDQ